MEYLLVSIFNVAMSVAQIAIVWQLFTKAGVAGWKTIVPLYDIVLAGRIANASTEAKLFLWMYFGSILGLLGSLFVYGVAAFVGLESVVVNILLFLVALAAVLAIMGSIVPAILLLVKFAGSYTAGVVRWLVFLFVPLVGVLVVNPVKYKKTSDVPGEQTPPQFRPSI